jgi:very-short-patch-repair endonuclease
MDGNLLFLIAAIMVVVALITRFATTAEKRKVFKNNAYSYSAKALVMSSTEAAFFTKLERCVDERYYVFPQVHLSSLLDHRIKGQDWGIAFRHINGKSVDFVLCDKITLRPTYAIELDDSTHEMPDRRKRDAEVERIFEQAQLPLVRFINKDISDNEIIQSLSRARALIQ